MDFTELVLKHAPWSFSKYGLLEKCLLQYHMKHVQKKRELGVSTESKVGVAVHYVSEHVTRHDVAPTEELLRDAVSRGKLTTNERDALHAFVPKIERFASWLRNFIVVHGVTDTLVEYQLGINRYFDEAPFMPGTIWTPEELQEPWTGRGERPDLKPLSGEALHAAVLSGAAPVMRGVLDLGIITGKNDMIVIDHKSGKHKDIREHTAQLNVYRLLSVARYPVRSVQGAIHYVETGRMDWTAPMTRDEILGSVKPWLVTYLNSQHRRLHVLDSSAEPPRPEIGWQCSYCGYVQDCPEGRAEAERRAEARKKKGQTPGGISI